MADRLTQKLRADARENRDRVVDAARALFAERGLDVPMREIARRAEVGPATLYRRFPTKQALIDEAFTGELQECTRIVRDGCADPDPWRGLSTVVVEITVLNSRNHGFVDAFPGVVDLTEHRTAMVRALTGLCRRAQAAGALRKDFVLDDLILMFRTGRAIRPVAARRYAALALAAFRASDAAEPLPPYQVADLGAGRDAQFAQDAGDVHGSRLR